MGALFKTPKVAKAKPGVDPADTANRKGLARLARLNDGGSNSTILTDAMGRATLTGMG